MDDLADLARRDIAHLVVDDAGLDIERRLAGRAGLAQLVIGMQHRRQRRDLGLAVEVPQPHARHAALHFLQHLDRHDRRPVVALGQRSKVGTLEQRRAQQRDPDRRRREEGIDAMARDQRQDHVRPRLARDDVGRAQIYRGPEEHVELRAVVQRQRMQHDVAGLHIALDDAGHVFPQHRLVAQHRALGQRLGAAGVDDLQQ